MTTKHLLRTLFLLCCMLAGTQVMPAATTVSIPTAAGSYMDWSNADITNASVENNGANVGSTRSNTVVSFTVNNTVAQDYVLTFATGNKNNSATIHVQLTASDETVIINNWTVSSEKTGAWTPTTTHNYFISNLPIGTYTLRFTTSDVVDYAGNWGKLAFYAASDYNQAPGVIGIASGSYDGPKLENSNTNVGYVSNGGKATYSFICNTAGVYKMTIPMTKYGDGSITTIVTDNQTATEEANGTWTMTNPTGYADTDITVEGELTTGMKTLTMQFATTASFLCNYKDITMTRIADHYSKIGGVTVAGQTVTTGATSDWYCQLPISYAATTTFGATALHGTVAVTAKDGSDASVAVTDNGNGTYTIATPAMGQTTTVTMVLTPNSGTVSGKTTYTFKLFRIGELSLTAVTVDGKTIDVLSDINNSPYSATYDACYTTVPVVAATQIDEAAATVDAPSISGTTYTYTIHGSMAGGSITRDYTLVLNNVHVYAPTGDEETVEIKANGGTIENNIWTNGVYTVATTSLDSYNQYFKMNGDSYTISVPSDVVVKQVIMKDCSNNYPGNDARLTAVSSTGATAYLPVDNKYYHDSEGTRHDIVVNLEGHAADTDIVLTQPKSGQPMAWIQLTIVKQAPTTPPVKTAESVTVVRNHAVVAVTFDREIAGNVNATINGGTVTAEGGSAVLYFPVWNLAYSTEYTLTIAAGAVADTYGNKNAAAINIAVNTGAKPVVEKAAYDYVVSTADELKAAISAIDATNTSAAAGRKVIFLKNGTYDLGSTGTSTVQWVNAHNISLVGESMDGVIICGTSRDISNPVLNIRKGSGQYLQDLTVRNLTDFDKQERDGVSVTVYGGNKAIFRNVTMQAQQDTHVTGERAYYIGCQFYGAVDFICGGGDHFYDQCRFVITNSGYITAPSTNAANKWGYVMQHCTIDKYVGSYTYEANGNFSLGRPWQGEPRNYWLNTTMNVKPAADGWGGMGTLPTHFYEYNSTDGNGNAIDLSVRKNSPTSTNSYTPVLTNEQAARFTVENVLGGTDSWLPTEECAQVEAPVVSIEGSTLSWTAVEDARCYVVFKDGQYLTNLTATEYELTDEGIYSVRAANQNGGLGAASGSIALKRTIKADAWSTIVVPFAVSDVENTFGSGTKVARLTDVSGTVLNFENVNAIEANEPYMIKVTKDFTGATIAGADINYGSPAKTVGSVTFQGVYNDATIPAGAFFVHDNSLYRADDNTNTIRALRAYFTTTSGARELSFSIDGETTAIKSIDNSAISRPDNCYDLSGRRIATAANGRMAKGLYIVNGRKVVIK